MTNTTQQPNIVITGATGHVGSRVTQLLIQAGVRPTLLMRDASKLSSEVREASNVVEGDLLDADFLRNSTKNADALFLLVASNYISDDPYGEMLTIGRNAAEAIKQNGIARTVLLSSHGAQLSNAGFISRLGQVEKILNEVGKNVLSLRPGYFFTNLFMSLEELKHGVFTKIGSLDVKTAWNDPRDIGDVVAARLLNTSWTGRGVQHIDGPEDLSWNDIARIVTAATGKEINAVETTADDMRQALIGAGISPAAAEGFIEMGTGIANGAGDGYQRTYLSTTPTTLEAWAYANLRPALG